MENKSTQTSLTPKSKSRYLRRAFFVLLILLAAFSVFEVAKTYYFKWRQRNVQKLAQDMQKQYDDSYKAAMADTYGGKTPQETLQMYIDAVEKGDYELASKYFIGDYQERELKSLQKFSEIEIRNFIENLKVAKIIDKNEIFKKDYNSFIETYNRSDMPFEEYITKFNLKEFYVKEEWMEYSANNKNFDIYFKLYPNNIWKIVRI
ncbi:MAG: hypothetical protein AB1472_07385 [Candidatus Omnitrophota bacterium]